MCDATFCLRHLLRKAGRTSAAVGLLLGAAPASSLGRHCFCSQAVPVLVCPFHQKALLLIPESFLLQVGPVTTYAAVEIGGFPSLTAAFYALDCYPPSPHLVLTLTHPHHPTFPRDQAFDQICFSFSYLQAVAVFFDTAQTRGLPGTHGGVTRLLHLPCGDLRAKIHIF